MYTDDRDNRLKKVGHLGIRAIFPLTELTGLTNSTLFSHLGIDPQQQECKAEAKKRLLYEAIQANAPMPKDVLKFANKLKGLCEGIS